MIHPYIAYLSIPLEARPNFEEVNHVFTSSVQELINPKNEKLETREIRGVTVDVPYFHLSQQKVWGATAMILSEFKTCISEVL
jgi:hypothetical protein